MAKKPPKALANQLPLVPDPEKPGELKLGLLASIEDALLWGKNEKAIAVEQSKLHGLPIAEVVAAIKHVRQIWDEEMAATRHSRIAKNRQRLDRIISKAFAMGELKTSTDAIMQQSKLVGDLSPEIHVMLGGDKSPADMLKQAEELRLLALKEPGEE